ncbi:60S ribosomal protein L6, mitochondrial, partial [Mucuna pruriens]
MKTILSSFRHVSPYYEISSPIVQHAGPAQLVYVFDARVQRSKKRAVLCPVRNYGINKIHYGFGGIDVSMGQVKDLPSILMSKSDLTGRLFQGLDLHSRNVLMGNLSALELMEAKFFRFLKIVGVGYKARAEAAGRLLYLKLGYSHEVELAVPPAVRVFCFKNNVICCTGIDKQRVHQFAATVRTCKPPEVYKGKGIMYVDEVIKKKQGKNLDGVFLSVPEATK